MKDPKDKENTSSRIKKIRKEAGLRQWELAKILGTTQSAVHKYEHGVIPEPRRLLKLARIGDTTIEWILTGRHWENGAAEKERVSADTLHLACALKKVSSEKRKIYLEAIDILEESLKVLEKRLGASLDDCDPMDIARTLKGSSPEILALLSTASYLQKAIQKKIMSAQRSKFKKVKPDKDF